MAAVLALVALLALRTDMRIALSLVWMFNIEGILGSGLCKSRNLHQHVDPAKLGASYYLAVLNVPAMIVVHIIIFAYLMGSARCLVWAPR